MPDDNHRPRVVRPNSGPPRRRITQIAVCYDSNREVQETNLFALCSDGSVWIMVWGADDDGDHSHWLRLVDIPAED